MVDEKKDVNDNADYKVDDDEKEPTVEFIKSFPAFTSFDSKCKRCGERVEPDDAFIVVHPEVVYSHQSFGSMSWSLLFDVYHRRCAAVEFNIIDEHSSARFIFKGFIIRDCFIYF